MPPTVILIRHGQALHNIDKKYWLHDPLLSDAGAEQCRTSLRDSLKKRLEGESDLAIISSPMRRTLQTAFLSLDFLLEKGFIIQADPNWQENSSKPCDTGSPISELEKEWPTVDFSHVDPVYPDKTSPAGQKYAFRREALLARARSGLKDLYARREKIVIVVSHSSYLRMAVTGRWFMNGDYRVFDFVDDPDGELPFKLKEHEDTECGGLGLSWQDRVPIGSGLPDDEVAADVVMEKEFRLHEEHKLASGPP